MRTDKPLSAAWLAVLLLGACAKSEMPAPNKNTNWLDRCETDGDCADELECRCGLCTVTCESDATCGEHDEQQALCWREQSEELAEQCGAPVGLASICVPPEMVEDVEPVEGIIADGLNVPTALVVSGERIYWLEGSRVYPSATEPPDGALKSARLDGWDVVTHLDELAPSQELVVDSTHAYFAHAGIRGGDRSFLARVPLADGELEPVYETVAGSFYGLAVVESRLYFMCLSPALYGLYVVPNDGSLYTTPNVAPTGAVLVTGDVGRNPYPYGLLAVDDALYWSDRAAVRRVAMEGDGEVTDLAVRDDASDLIESVDDLSALLGFVGRIASDGERLFWLWNDSRGASGVSSVGLAGGAVQRIEVANRLVTSGLAVDATHIYWAQRAIDRAATTIARTERSSGETEAIAELDEGNPVLIALSEEHVFVASGDPEAHRGGYIMRFSKDRGGSDD